MFLSSNFTHLLNISRNEGSTISLDSLFHHFGEEIFLDLIFFFIVIVVIAVVVVFRTTQLTNSPKKHTQSPFLIAVQQKKGTSLNVIPCKFLLRRDFCHRTRENWFHKHMELPEYYHSVSAHSYFILQLS